MEGLLQALAGASKGAGDGGGLPAGLAGLLGVEGSGLDMKALSAQAANLWKHLDDLAENDGEAYQAFLAKQAKGMEEERALAGGSRERLTAAGAPTLVVEAAVTAPVGPGVAHFAVLHLWPAADGRLQPATCSQGTASAQPITSTTTSLDSFRVPLAQLRAPTTQKPEGGDGGSTMHHHLLCNAQTLQLAVAGTPVLLRSLLVEAACQFAESKQCLTLSRNARQLKVNSGALSADQQQQQQPQQTADNLQAAVAGTSAEKLSLDLMSQLSSFSSSPLPHSIGSAKAPVHQPAPAGSGTSPAPTSAARPPLIQELPDSTTHASYDGSSADEVASLPGGTPLPQSHTHFSAQELSVGSAEVLRISSEDGEFVRVIARLPGVSKADGVQIESEKECVIFTTPDGALRVALPTMVDEAASVAKFDSKTRVLTLTMPCARG